LQEAIDAAPQKAQGHYNLGVCLEGMGQPEKAVAVYETATQRDPTYANAFYNAGTVLKDLGRLDEAVQKYESAVALVPNDVDAWGNLAVCRQRQRRLPEAEIAARRAVELNPNARGHLYTLITSLIWQSDPVKTEQARKIRKQAVGRGMWADVDQYPAVYDPSIRSSGWPSLDDFPSVRAAAKLLESQWEAVRDEMVEHELLAGAEVQYEAIASDARWTVIPAYHAGQQCSCAGRGCSVVCALLPQLQRHVAVTGIMFSVVGAGAHLRPHCGPNNRRLKLHLGLQVPQPTRMRIGSETRSWTEGKCNFLDDSFEHEVTNESEDTRVRSACAVSHVYACFLSFSWCATVSQVVLEVIFDHPAVRDAR
jgi:aspartate beta-hydroxylase